VVQSAGLWSGTWEALPYQSINPPGLAQPESPGLGRW
jgi:hypothetical protein